MLYGFMLGAVALLMFACGLLIGYHYRRWLQRPKKPYCWHATMPGPRPWLTPDALQTYHKISEARMRSNSIPLAPLERPDCLRTEQHQAAKLRKLNA